jgi:regulator of replication initiation timing
MQTPIPRRLWLVSIALAAAINLCGAADLPVTRIVLYKHGVGFFERQGIVPMGEEARLDFRTADMNDVLKSLTVTDASGNRIAAIRYDSNETLDQRLARYPFTPVNDQPLTGFLDGLKGARVELKVGGTLARGAILGARGLAAPSDPQNRPAIEQVSLLLDSGELATYNLATVNSIRFLDPNLEEQLRQYLQTLGQSNAHEQRRIFIDFAEPGAHTLHISYISPTAIWKSSYRLTLAQSNSILEGWAIVDNTTDEDWNHVNLSVVSGRPISFVSLLDTPRYGQRSVAELPADRAAGPVVYGGSADVVAQVPSARVPIEGSGSGGGMGGGTYKTQSGAAGGVIGGVVSSTGAAPPSQRLSEFAKLESSSVQGATGATLGELFEYDFDAPITVKKNQSAMLPFLQNRVSAHKLLIYTDNDGEHPVNAAEITNDTEKTLDGGPITVYDGGAYAGEALFETLKAGDKRLIGYAVDYGTRITSSFNSASRRVREVHVKDGCLSIRYSNHSIRTYTINNVDAKPKTLILQQDGVSQYSVISPKPVERTTTAYRFEANLQPNSSREYKIELEQTYQTSDSITSSTPDFLMTLVNNKDLSASDRSQLNAVVELERQIADSSAQIEATKSQVTDLTEDQMRLRQNIDSLNRVKGQEEQVRAYSESLSKNEAQLASLRDRERSLATRKSNLDTSLRSAVSNLQF